jgi:hypothetical protein
MISIAARMIVATSGSFGHHRLAGATPRLNVRFLERRS